VNPSNLSICMDFLQSDLRQCDPKRNVSTRDLGPIKPASGAWLHVLQMRPDAVQHFSIPPSHCQRESLDKLPAHIGELVHLAPLFKHSVRKDVVSLVLIDRSVSDVSKVFSMTQDGRLKLAFISQLGTEVSPFKSMGLEIRVLSNVREIVLSVKWREMTRLQQVSRGEMFA